MNEDEIFPVRRGGQDGFSWKCRCGYPTPYFQRTREEAQQSLEAHQIYCQSREDQ